MTPCDKCHPLEFLKEKYGKELEFPDDWFSTDDWLIKRGTEYEDNDRLFAKRAEFVRQYIKGLEDREVVVVTHGDFAHYLANQWEMLGSYSNFERLDQGEVASMVIHELSDSETQLREEAPSWVARDSMAFWRSSDRSFY
jgi:broad specificity phosphatase PhoE